MSKVAGCKRKLKTRTITEKHKILQEVEKGESSASISKKYGGRSKAKIVWMVKRQNKTLFRSQEKQNFCEKSQDATFPT